MIIEKDIGRTMFALCVFHKEIDGFIHPPATKDFFHHLYKTNEASMSKSPRLDEGLHRKLINSTLSLVLPDAGVEPIVRESMGVIKTVLIYEEACILNTDFTVKDVHFESLEEVNDFVIYFINLIWSGVNAASRPNKNIHHIVEALNGKRKRHQ